MGVIGYDIQAYRLSSAKIFSKVFVKQGHVPVLLNAYGCILWF